VPVVPAGNVWSVPSMSREISGTVMLLGEVNTNVSDGIDFRRLILTNGDLGSLSPRHPQPGGLPGCLDFLLPGPLPQFCAPTGPGEQQRPAPRDGPLPVLQSGRGQLTRKNWAFSFQILLSYRGVPGLRAAM